LAPLPELTSEKKSLEIRIHHVRPGLWRYGQRSPPPGHRCTQLPNTSRARGTRTRRRRPNKLRTCPRAAPGPTQRDPSRLHGRQSMQHARDHGTPSTRRLTSNTQHDSIPGRLAGHDSPPFSRPEPAAPVPRPCPRPQACPKKRWAAMSVRISVRPGMDEARRELANQLAWWRASERAH
jgi:hypothetical protein